MNWPVFLAVFSLSAFSAIHCLNEKTVGELRKTLAPLKYNLDQALTGYRKHKYTVFQHAVQKFEISKTIMNIPETEILNEYHNIQNAFYKLTLYQFVYPVLSDQIRLSDALKVNALGVLLRKQNISLLSPEVADLKQSIREIIAEEKRVDYNFNQANLVLDDLYYDIHNVDVDLFSQTSGFIEYSMSTLKGYCAENSTNCQPETTETADKITTALTALRKLLPINTPEKVESVAEWTSGYVQLETALSKLIEAKRIVCFAVKCVQQNGDVIEMEPKDHHDHQDLPKETLPELLKEVNLLKTRVEFAISGYQKHKYTVFAETGNKYLFSDSLKERIARLPANSTFDDSADAKLTFTELIAFRYLYPILADPVLLGDALKFNAIINGIIKKDNGSSIPSISESTPTLEKAKETIKKIIVEENKVKHAFDQENAILDELYVDLGKPNVMFLFPIYGIIKRETSLLRSFCAKNSCTSGLISVLTKFEVSNRILNIEHPVNSDKKIEAVANVLKKFWELKVQLSIMTYGEHIDCDAMKCVRNVKKQES